MAAYSGFCPNCGQYKLQRAASLNAFECMGCAWLGGIKMLRPPAVGGFRR